jgi:hypothetical protein
MLSSDEFARMSRGVHAAIGVIVLADPVFDPAWQISRKFFWCLNG